MKVVSIVRCIPTVLYSAPNLILNHPSDCNSGRRNRNIYECLVKTLCRNMALPTFTAECSLYTEEQHYALNKNILKIDRIVMPQFDVYECQKACTDSCCLCLHDPEGIIESSCLCNDVCISNCMSDCNSSFTNNVFSG